MSRIARTARAVFTPQGELVDQAIKTDTPFARNIALSPDQQWLYVGDGRRSP